MMSISNNIKHFLAGLVTGGLEKFSDRHKGESCYIFGSGPSVKWFDLSLFNDRPAICCGVGIPFHNDFHKLNVRYVVLPEPWVFMPKLFQPKDLQAFNVIGAEYLKFIKSSPDKEFFIHLSNMPAVSGRNINYFFRRMPDRGTQTDRLFNRPNLLHGSFHVALALAYYMGFSKVYLVGFDAWTIQPARTLHWYEKGMGELFTPTNFAMDILGILKDVMEIYTISVDGGSVNVKNIPYEEYTGKQPLFRENSDLVSPYYLKIMASYPGYKIF